MKLQFKQFMIAAVIGAAALVKAEAAAYSTTSGASYDGELYKVSEGVVSIDVGEDKIEVSLSDFDANSKSEIESWMAENPDKVDVYTKWDVQPRIKSSSMPQLPDALAIPDFAGMVSVDLVLDESGKVISASVKKSTHTELESPSLEAAKTWIFEPAEIAGKPVKSKLRVPFKFTYSPPAKS